MDAAISNPKTTAVIIRTALVHVVETVSTLAGGHSQAVSAVEPGRIIGVALATGRAVALFQVAGVYPGEGIRERGGVGER